MPFEDVGFGGMRAYVLCGGGLEGGVFACEAFVGGFGGHFVWRGLEDVG